ncbi:putative N-acetylgalactosamine-4-sulfatase [Fragilariopsis cylindrus CCMP1102]|uniref:Putative N-acetylgalactosamine-4-sulfatase n=1 Tax=Fragilariopsis cylindrus CCMP1102 TaxID=635003 RepID=A0A1E7FQ99_9STRA|nr:putative N-acetylgalactosamine-4-sulfatase [Fragilariopsis cylindrus CCMP1102]|eukprot:OEU20326.1 putative N-acetylgalactosamine-4-sulfatase [Fragilariopsis cylindrus CCMP1102]
MLRIIDVWRSAAYCSSVLIFVILASTSLSTSAANNPSSSSRDQKEQEQEQHDNLPNIVMIVMDDLGSHDLGLHGTGINTPNIDGLVTDGNNGNNGIYLDDYYVLPYCSPTRSALFSGLYPIHTGVHNVIRPISTAGLPLGIETLPELLKRAKTTKNSKNSNSSTYQPHAVGKWHIGHSSWNQTPTFRGFDSFFGFYIGGEDYFTHKSGGGGVDLHYDSTPNCGEGCSKVVNERGNYSTHVFTREAINKEIRSSSSSSSFLLSSPTPDTSAPLFLYLAYQAVHCPNEVPEKYIKPYKNRTDWTHQRKNYAGMLSAADEGIGNVITALQQYPTLWNNTVIIFTTDNGGPTTVGCTQGSSNYPKRGGKCSVWEGGTTGDAILSGPALQRLLLSKTTSSSEQKDGDDEGLYVHRRFRHLFHVVDWFPTIAEWINVIPRHQTRLDGVSQVGALSDSSNSDGLPARTELFGGYAQCLSDPSKNPSWWGPSLRHLNWKIVQGESGGPDANETFPPGTKQIHNNLTTINKTKYLLFDLEKDPSEENDISELHPEVLTKMIYKLKLYRKSFVYPQINDDSQCPFTGLVNTTVAGPAWYVLGMHNVVAKVERKILSICIYCKVLFTLALVSSKKTFILSTFFTSRRCCCRIPWCKDLQESLLALQ